MSDVKSTNRFALFFFIFFILSGKVLYFLPGLLYLPYTILSALLSVFSFGITILVYFIATKKDIKTTLRFNRISIKNIFLAILLAYASQPIMNFLAVGFSLFFPNLVEESFDLASGSSFWSMLFTMAVMPAFLEEITLRGIFLTGYEELGAFRSVLYTSILFGLLHMNPQQVPYAIFAGLIFCFLVQRMGSIWAAIIPHFLINGSSVVAVFMLPEETQASALDIFTPQELMLYTGGYALVSLPWLLFLIYLVARFNPITDNNDANSRWVREHNDKKSRDYDFTHIIIEENPQDISIPEPKVKFFTWEILVILILFVAFGVIPYMDYFFYAIGSY